MAALAVALLLAIYSGAAAELGNIVLASASALAALALAAWVAVTLVPVLARRTPLRWIGYKMEYKVTREGWIYFVGTLLVALAALNTGNNLLFMILASLIALILMSGILSSIALSGVEMALDLPEHIFANQAVRTLLELRNEKATLPSFSLKVEAAKSKKDPPAAMLETPVYFPFVPKHDSVKQPVPMTFKRRGIHRQDAFRISTRFPFGFLQKARRVSLTTEVLVYPSVEPTQELIDILPGLQGAMESITRGHGQDLYALRDYLPNDSARHVHWKASARLGQLMVREFTREDDYRVLVVFDPHLGPKDSLALQSSIPYDNSRFERAVTLCAGLIWHFYERNAFLQFRSEGIDLPVAPAEQSVFPILRYLARVQPRATDLEHKLLHELASSPDLFKVVITSQPHGSIPASVWNTSYVVFLDDYAKNT